MNEATLTELVGRGDERHLLLAVDESANSRRAVMYVADFFGSYRDVFVSLLTIIQEPSEDYFPTEEKRRRWLEDKRQAMAGVLEEYRRILLDAGITEERVAANISVRPCVSIGDAILEEQEKLRCCIVVVGRRGISHDEEFIFGSTSNKILHHAHNCAVMVIE